MQDTAASYGLGAVGGLLYLRLLNRSVDGMGASFLGAAGGQARLLIPVILALAYNRRAFCSLGQNIYKFSINKLSYLY